MTITLQSKAAPQRIPFGIILFITLCMAALYTILDVVQPTAWLFALLAFIPGLIGHLALRAGGFSRDQLYLRLRPISLPGLAALAATTILLLPILSSSTSWGGWQWLPALVYAPASGVAQELYFRSSLLPVLEQALHGKKHPALFLHSAIFIGFHLRTFRSLPSSPVALVVAFVLFLAGCSWGWQVQRDRTVTWAMVQHSLFLVLMSMFNWG